VAFPGTPCVQMAGKEDGRRNQKTTTPKDAINDATRATKPVMDMHPGPGESHNIDIERLNEYVL